MAYAWAMRTVSPAPTSALSWLAACALAACMGRDTKPPEDRGPIYTPSVANQLHAIAKECTFSRNPDDPGTEIRLCHGPQTMMQIELGTVTERRLRRLDITVRATSAFEATWVLRPVLDRLIDPIVLDEMERKLNAGADPGPEYLYENLRLRAMATGTDYSVIFLW